MEYLSSQLPFCHWKSRHMEITLNTIVFTIRTYFATGPNPLSLLSDSVWLFYSFFVEQILRFPHLEHLFPKYMATPTPKYINQS